MPFDQAINSSWRKIFRFILSAEFIMDRETVIKECGCKTFWVRGWDGFIRIIPVEKCEKHKK